MFSFDFSFDILFYYLLFNFVFYASNLILYFIDSSELLSRHKLQPQELKNIIQTYNKCLPVSIKNTFIYNIPAAISLPFFINWYGFSFTWIKTIFDIIMSYILMDIVYYFTHRLLHTKRFYAKYHKKHHEITCPVGLSSTYLTIIDFYSNILSIYLPPIILSSDHTTFTLWIIISTLNTVLIGHSGYDPIASFHDNHHKNFNCNYGVGIVADYIFDTRY